MTAITPLTSAANRTLKDEIAAYWTARATHFDASPGHGIAPGGEREGWLRLLRENLGDLSGRSVLELAPGTGEFTGLLLELGAQVTGLDLSEGMLQRARAKHSRHGRKVALYLGDAEETREPDLRHDAVVCRHLVWTLPDPARAIADWYRVLKPGGRLFVVDGDWVRLPAFGALRRRVGRVLMQVMGPAPEPIDWEAHERIMQHVHFRQGLRVEPFSDMLRDAGFEAIRVGSIARIRRAQRAAAPFPRSLTVGVYRDFCLTATRPMARAAG